MDNDQLMKELEELTKNMDMQTPKESQIKLDNKAENYTSKTTNNSSQSKTAPGFSSNPFGDFSNFMGMGSEDAFKEIEKLLQMDLGNLDIDENDPDTKKMMELLSNFIFCLNVLLNR
jgi:hypothetical protein